MFILCIIYAYCIAEARIILSVFYHYFLLYALCPYTVYKTCTYNYKVLFKILYVSLVGEGADDNVFIRGYWRLNADQKKALTLCVFREEGFLTVSLRLCVLTILV